MFQPWKVRRDKKVPRAAAAVWFLVGNGGMGYGGYYWALYGDYMGLYTIGIHSPLWVLQTRSLALLGCPVEVARGGQGKYRHTA